MIRIHDIRKFAAFVIAILLVALHMGFAQVPLRFDKKVTLRTGHKDIALVVLAGSDVVTTRAFRRSQLISEDSMMHEGVSVDLLAKDLDKDGVDELFMIYANETDFYVDLCAARFGPKNRVSLKVLIHRGPLMTPDELQEDFSVATTTRDSSGYDRISFHYIDNNGKRRVEFGYNRKSRRFVAQVH